MNWKADDFDQVRKGDIGKEEECHTFLFKNFPKNCDLKSLLDRFMKVGRVKDVFYPGKKDKVGKLFGFVRFPRSQDEGEILRRLNNIWFGSYKMWAIIPRFSRDSLTITKNQHPVRILSRGGWRKDDLSFADVVSVQKVKSVIDNSEMKADGIHYQSSAEDKMWWSECYTGFLRRKFSWNDYAEELQSECGSLLKLRSLGGNLIPFQKAADRNVGELMKEFDEWIHFWFEWVRPWKEIDINLNREVWTLWYGVPIHAWTDGFFAKACAHLGLFIKLEEFKDKWDPLYSAKVLISSSCLSKIYCTMNVWIDGKSFTVRVVEACQCNYALSGKQCDKLDEESNSEWSDDRMEQGVREQLLDISDGQISDGPADATVREFPENSNCRVEFSSGILNVPLDKEPSLHADCNQELMKNNHNPVFLNGDVEVTLENGDLATEDLHVAEENLVIGVRNRFEVSCQEKAFCTNRPCDGLVKGPQEENLNSVGQENNKVIGHTSLSVYTVNGNPEKSGENQAQNRNTEPVLGANSRVVQENRSKVYAGKKKKDLVNQIGDLGIPSKLLKSKGERANPHLRASSSVLPNSADAHVSVGGQKKGDKNKRRKKKGSSKGVERIKEKQKWAKFVKGMENASKVRTLDSDLSSKDEDLTSKLIRDEA